MYNRVLMTPLSPAFWRDRSVFVTGGAGLVGSHVVDELLKLGARVVCLVRDYVPDSLLITSGNAFHIVRVDGNLEDQALLERVLGE